MDRSPFLVLSLDSAAQCEECVTAPPLAQYGLGGLSCYDQNPHVSVRFAVSLFCLAARCSKSSRRPQQPRMIAARSGSRNAVCMSRAKPKPSLTLSKRCLVDLPVKPHQPLRPTGAIATACPMSGSPTWTRLRLGRAKAKAMRHTCRALRHPARPFARPAHLCFTADQATAWAAASKAHFRQVLS